MNKQWCIIVKTALYVVGLVLAVYISVEALELIIDHTLK